MQLGRGYLTMPKVTTLDTNSSPAILAEETNKSLSKFPDAI